MVMGDIALQSYLHLVRGTAAVKLSTSEATGARSDAIVDERVKGGCHGQRCIAWVWSKKIAIKIKLNNKV